MKVFFNYINLLPNGNLEEQCNLFAAKGLEDHKWAFNNIIKFLQYQKERVEKTEITAMSAHFKIKRPIMCSAIGKYLRYFPGVV